MVNTFISKIFLKVTSYFSVTWKGFPYGHVGRGSSYVGDGVGVWGFAPIHDTVEDYGVETKRI